MTPVSYDQVISQNVVNRNIAVAMDFLSHLPWKMCDTNTSSPWSEQKSEMQKPLRRALA